MVEESTVKPRKKISTNALPAIFLVACAVIWFMYFRSPGGFSDADIALVKASIKAEFEKQKDFQVSDVGMIKESENKLVGYATLRAGGVDVHKTCTATMAVDGKNYIWTCK